AGLRASVLGEEISGRFSSAPAPASSPVCRGHSSPQTGETGFATVRSGGGAGCVPGATRQTEGGETPMTSSSAPPMSDVRVQHDVGDGRLRAPGTAISCRLVVAHE
ncbi:unnamed protein product, partial [Ectocarpus sp. 8 AP-2014]